MGNGCLFIIDYNNWIITLTVGTWCLFLGFSGLYVISKKQTLIANLKTTGN